MFMAMTMRTAKLKVKFLTARSMKTVYGSKRLNIQKWM